MLWQRSDKGKSGLVCCLIQQLGRFKIKKIIMSFVPIFIPDKNITKHKTSIKKNKHFKTQHCHYLSHPAHITDKHLIFKKLSQ